MTATTVFDLELPSYDPDGLDREARHAVLGAAQAEHWLVRTPRRSGWSAPAPRRGPSCGRSPRSAD